VETLVENLMLNRLGPQKRQTQRVSKLLSYIDELHLRQRPKARAAFGKSQISQDKSADKGSKNGNGEPLPIL
jgi:hypothetical protein